MATTYRLEIWDKTRRRYWCAYQGGDLIRAELQEKKSYNRRDWNGKARILKITVETVKEVPAHQRRPFFR